MRRLARAFLTIQRWGDPFEETVVLPALVSLVAMRLGDGGKLDETVAAAIVIASHVLAGAWLGAAWGLMRGHRVLLRGVFVGLLTSALVAATTSVGADVQKMREFAGVMAGLGITAFWTGHYPVAFVREIALVSEEQWQRGVKHRAWLKDVLRMTVGAKSLEGATLAQAMTVRTLHIIAGAVGALILAISTGQPVFGIEPKDWPELIWWFLSGAWQWLLPPPS